MKKVMLSLLIAISAAAPILSHPLPAAAAESTSIGVVDVQRILQTSPLLKALNSAQSELEAAEKKLQDARDKKREELQEKQKTMDPDEFRKLVRKYEDEILAQAKKEEEKLNRRRDEIRKQKEKLEKDVTTAVEAIAKQKGLGIVINKQLVLFGGVDITAEVISKLK